MKFYVLLDLRLLVSFLCLKTVCGHSAVSESELSSLTIGTALLDISYVDGSQVVKKSETGSFGYDSLMEPRNGILIHVRSKDNANHGCTHPVNVPSGNTSWIALVERGSCTFKEKVHNIANKHKASAVVIYDNEDKDSVLIMLHGGRYFLCIIFLYITYVSTFTNFFFCFIYVD